jgi:hypothetical protein
MFGLLTANTLYISNASFYLPCSANMFATPNAAKLLYSSPSRTAMYLSIAFFK